MNASDFSSVPDLSRLLATLTPRDNQLGPFPPADESNGVGSSWERKLVENIDSATVLLSEVGQSLPPAGFLTRSPLTALSKKEIAADADISTTDPLGTAANDLKTIDKVSISQNTDAISTAVPYPGYVLRYDPGFILNSRPAVAQWQAQMKQRGWRLVVDGLYGPESAFIARQFQAEKGLVTDGIVGARTWQAAFDNSTITGENEPTPAPIAPMRPEADNSPLGSTPYPGSPLSYRPLQPLSFDAQTQLFQQRLKELRWQLDDDGFFGARTDTATRLFQRQHNLEVDGIVGPRTWAIAFSENALAAPAQQDLNPVATTGRINSAGLELIKSFEGLRLNSYQDAVGVWTIGYGHTKTAGPGQQISYAQATNLLRSDVANFEKAVTRAVRVPITENQFAALVSFAYNVGSGALQSSTLIRRLNAGDTYGAANEFRRWNRAGGQVLAGLSRRREAERSLFLS